MIVLPLLIALAQSPTASATPAPAPLPAPAAGPPPAFMAAAQAFNGCLGKGVAVLPATVVPTTGAQQVIAGCTAQRAAIDAQFEALIGRPSVPAASRDQARAQYQAQMDQLPAQLATAIAQRGAAPKPQGGR